MLSENNYRIFEKVVLGYTNPRFHQTPSGCYVDFLALDPNSGELKRKKFVISSGLSKKKQREVGAQMIADLCAKLSRGWTPWVDTTKARSFIRIEDALNRYLEGVARSERRKTILSYTSRVTIFRKFLQSLDPAPEYVYQIDHALCVRFLEYVHIDRNNKARTRNNYLGWLTTFCGWMTERGMMEKNPCAGIKKIRETAKKRQPLTAEMMSALHKELHKADKWLLLACMMEYYTFIRPTELSWLRIGDISVKEQTIFVSGEHSKNHRDAFVAVPEIVIKLMLELDIFRNPDSYYLFTSGLKPGKVRHGGDIFNKAWTKFRKAMGWDDCYQFYSLKDTGIRDLSNACGVVTARNQARHSDISVTNKYLQGRRDAVPEELKKFKGAL